MSILDLQGLPLPAAHQGTGIGPQNSDLSVTLCEPVAPQAWDSSAGGSDNTAALS